MTPARRASRRGLALIAVLVVMGGAILVATSLLFVAQAQSAGSHLAAGRVRSHALMWSGVQAAMTELNRQRDTILEGNAPRLEGEFVIYETESRTGVVRLLPVGPGGERLVAEAGKLDLNVVEHELLAATGLIDETQAQAIADHRDRTLRRPYQSVEELLQVEGLWAGTLYGPLDELGASDEDDAGPEPTADLEGPRGLADLVTVYGFEPALQRNGKLRINLNVPWSDELGERVAERFGSDAAQTLQRIFQSGTDFDTEAKLFQVLRFFEVPPETWPDIVDTFTTDEGEFHYGRLDINTASYEALAALPGLEPEQAASIVQMRDDLPEEDRATIAWPVVQGIVEPEAYDVLAGRITTRCWTWRLRVAAGEVAADDPAGVMTGRVVFDVVIDLSVPRPRVAYLREVTWLRTAALIASAAASDDRADLGPAEDLPAEADLALEDVVDAGESDFGDGDEAFAFSGAPDGAPAAPGQPPGDEPVSAGVDEDLASGDLSTPSPPRTRIGRWTGGGWGDAGGGNGGGSPGGGSPGGGSPGGGGVGGGGGG